MLAHMLCKRRAVALSVVLLAACAAREVQLRAEPDEPSPTEVLERVVVIGASASAGFMLDDSLADALQAALPGTVLDLADEMLFLAPAENGAAQVEQALAGDPTLVVAIDFPFWFGYGVLRREEARMKLLETGLALLERFDCPLLVGGFPDMSAAIGTMLREEHVPQSETLARLNARLAQWADARESVLVIDLPGALARLESGEPVELFGGRWPAEEEDLLQWDHLHPTDHGLVVLAGIVLEDVAAAFPELALAFDADAVFAAID